MEKILSLFTVLNVFVSITFAQTYKTDPVLNIKDKEAIYSAVPKAGFVKVSQKRKVLIFSRTCGFRHYEGIVAAKEAFQAMASHTGTFDLVLSDSPSDFESENLEKYDAIILNNTTGMFLGDTEDNLKKLSEIERQKCSDDSSRLIQNLMKFVENGGGLFVIHGSADSYNRKQFLNRDFISMINGQFMNHPWTVKNDPLTIRIDDPKSPITRNIWNEDSFKIQEEVYQLGDAYDRKSCRVLLSLDVGKSPVTTPNGGKAKIRDDKDIPLVFVKKYGKGRIAYSGFGHETSNYKDPNIMLLEMRILQFVCGDLKADCTSIPQSKK